MQERLTDHTKYSRENPFDVPEGYFESIEDRIEGRIADEENYEADRPGLIRMIRPVLWLAASFALAFLLIYFPVEKILNRYAAEQGKSQTPAAGVNEDLLIGYDALDENSFFLMLTSTEDTTIRSEEMISYVTSGITDYELFSELTSERF